VARAALSCNAFAIATFSSCCLLSINDNINLLWWSLAAMRSMEDVAEHINEMQRIHDEYGQTFDELSRYCKRTVDAAVRIRA